MKKNACSTLAKTVICSVVMVLSTCVFAQHECIKIGKHAVYMLQTGGTSVISQDFSFLMGNVLLTTDGWNSKNAKVKAVKGKQWTSTLVSKMKNGDVMTSVCDVKQSSPGVFDYTYSWKSTQGKNPVRAYCQVRLDRKAYKKLIVNGQELPLLQQNKFNWYDKNLKNLEMKISSTGKNYCTIKVNEECKLQIATLAAGYRVMIYPKTIAGGLRLSMIIK